MSAATALHMSALLESNQLWHARELLGVQPAARQGIATGCAALDAALPGHGWPAGQLCELICAHGTSGEWSLILPALLTQLAQLPLTPSKKPAQLVLINPPYVPYIPAWQASGIAPNAVLKIDTSAHAQSASRACWVAEQALHCADVAAVVAWLPRVSADALRRLQIAAAQSQILLFVVRPLAAREQSSPAALRLVLHRLDALLCDVHVLKCRGGAAQAHVQMEILAPPLRALLQARKQHAQSMLMIKKIPQINPVFRMTPRSQGRGLLPDHLLFGNERAAEGPAMNARAQHGLDRTTTLTHLLNSHPLIAHTPAVTSIIIDRTVKREARHARSR